MPEYDSPQMIMGDSNDVYTFFYYWNTNFIIWVFFDYKEYFRIYVIKENDEIFDELQISCSNSVCPVLITPNGRYIGYLVQGAENPVKKIPEGEFYLELWIYEIIVDELGKNVILNKTKTIENFNTMMGLTQLYEFYHDDYLLSDELDIY